MLSDGHISLRHKSVNARFQCTQSGAKPPQKTEYFDFVAHMGAKARSAITVLQQ
jgi:hypothetical protein